MNRPSSYGGLCPPEFTRPVFTLRFASATAAAGVAEANVAAAAALAAAFQAIAAGLQHLAALGVAAGAGDAATFLRVLALAVAAAEIEVANLDAIPSAGARAGAIAQGLTKALQRTAGDGVAAVALDAEATLALLELQFAPRHHAHIRRGCGCGASGRKGRRRSGRESTPTFHDSAGHKQHSFWCEGSTGAPVNATDPMHLIPEKKPHELCVQSATHPTPKPPPWGAVSLLRLKLVARTGECCQ